MQSQCSPEFLNLFPARLNGAQWDGFIVFRGTTDVFWLRERIASSMLARAILDGNDYPDWNLRWLRLIEPQGKLVLRHLQPLLLQYCFTLLKEDYDRAAEVIERALLLCERGGASIQRIVYIEAAFLQAQYRCGTQKAEVWRSRIPEWDRAELFSRRKLEAAFAWSRGDFASFESLRSQGRDYFSALPDSRARNLFFLQWDRETERLRNLAEPHQSITKAAQI